MTYDFAALRFTEDENLVDRVYWYLCTFPVKEGEGVLAPIGAHSRLQFARVERTLTASEENAPYDLRLLKQVAAKYGARRLAVGRMICFEMGGLLYDSKHYTRFKRILFTIFEDEPNEEEKNLLTAYGVTETVKAASLREIPDTECVLLMGEHARPLAEQILLSVRKGEDNGLANRLY